MSLFTVFTTGCGAGLGAVVGFGAVEGFGADVVAELLLGLGAGLDPELGLPVEADALGLGCTDGWADEEAGS